MDIERIIKRYSECSNEEKEQIINELICELEKLNRVMNKGLNEQGASIPRLVLDGITDERDKIIDIILWDEDFISYINNHTRRLQHFYQNTLGTVDFIEIIEKILRIIIKKFAFYPSDIKSPKGILLNYCFKPLPKRKIKISYFDSYFYRYRKEFSVFTEFVDLDKRKDSIIIDDYTKDEDYYSSNRLGFDMVFHQNMTDSKDKRLRRGEKDNKVLDGVSTGDIALFNSKEEDDQVQQECIESILSNKNDFEEIHESTREVSNDAVIFKYSVDYVNFRLKNISLSENEMNKQLGKKLNNALWHWNIYKKDTGLIPYKISKLREDNFIELVYPKKDKKTINKKKTYIYVRCPTKKFNLVFSEPVEYYIQKLVIKNLSKKQRLLLSALFYELKPVEEVIRDLKYKNLKALDTEKSRIKGKIKTALLNDYEFIQQTFGETHLAFWSRKIKAKVDNLKNAENEKNLFTKY